MTTCYQEYVERKRREYGDKFDASDLAPQFIPYYHTGERITVAFVSRETGEVYEMRRGTVGATTGWKPCFLLMHNSRSRGSSYTLGAKDMIVAGKPGLLKWREFKRQEMAAI